MFPLILGGIANMVFTKTKFYKKHASPMDKGKVWKDGKRVFGENKTWIGFVSMIIFCIGYETNPSIQQKIQNFQIYFYYENTVIPHR